MKKITWKALRVFRTSLLMFVMLLCSAVASAQSFTVDGIRYYITSYDDDSQTVEVTYAESNYEGVISIPESVVFDNVEFVVTSIGYDAFWYSNITSIVLPNTIEHIRDFAFYGCENLGSVTLGNSLESIGYYAFYDCSKLSNIIFPESLTVIGASAFQHCSSLVDIVIPESVNSLGDYAFRDCSKLANVTLPSSLTSIEYGVFSGCSSLVNIVIPETVSYIGNYAFSACSSLTNVTILGSVTEFGSGIFEGCSNLEKFEGEYASEDGKCFIVDGVLRYFASTGLTEYKIPELVTSIGDGVFAECFSLVSLTIPETVTNIGNYAFSDCSSLEYITIPNSVTNIGAEAFAFCHALENIILPNSITSIEPATFVYSGLTNITIPESVTSIGDYAFMGCPLVSITIPESVTSMGNYVFADCLNLTEFKGKFVSEDGKCLVVDSVLKVFIAKDVVEYVIPRGVKSIGVSAFANCSNLVSVTFLNSVKSIDDEAFYGCSALVNIDMGDSLTMIGSSAFYNCDALVNITIPESVVSIGSSAFYGCDALNSIALPNSLSTLSYEMFCGCCNLMSVSLPDSLKTIEAYAFSNCDGLADILIPSSVKTIGSNTFYDCDGLTSVDLPDSLINLSSYVFYGCDNLVSVSLPDSLKSIGSYSFYNCSSLTDVIIPKSVTSIGSYAFRRCSALSSVTLSEALETINDGAFRDCKKLESVVLPNSVTYLGREVFCSCESLSDVILSKSLTSIYSSTFSECSSLVDVTLPNSLTTLGDYAFAYCSELTSITIPETVTDFGYNVFYECSNLKEFKGMNASDDGRCLIIDGILKSFVSAGLTEYTLPNIVRGIGEGVFAGCSNLINIVLGDSVNSIGYSAFSGCSGLVNFTIPKTVQSIGTYAFSDCSNLTSLIVPDSVTYIGEYAFQGCSSLSHVSLGNSLEGISPGMFYNCYSLHDITIPNSVKNISESAFEGCFGLSNFNGAFASKDGKCLIVEKKLIAFAPVGLSEYVIPDSVTNIGYGVFSGCSNLSNVTIPESVINIGNYAFSDCDGLTNIILPNTILTIGDCAFYDCDGLSSIAIPNSVTCINYSSFASCSSLTSVIIPNSVVDIDSYAFEYCKNVTQIDCQALEPPTCSYGVFSGIDKMVCMLTVPVGSKEAYQNANYWDDFQQIIETGTVLPKYLLTYIVDGEVYATDSIICGAVITPKAVPTKNGYIFSGWSEIPRIMPAEDFVVTGTFEISKEYQTACTQLEELVVECESLFVVNPVANLTQVLTEAKVFMANIQNASLTEINQVYKKLKKVRDAVVMIDVLVTHSDVELSITNDSIYPWVLDEANQCIANGNNGVKYSTSMASISYKSDYITELKLEWASYNSSRHQTLQMYVDGELKASTSNSSYSTSRIIIGPGEHVIAIRDSIGNSSSANNWSRVKNLIIRKVVSLEDSLLTAKSERITFENDGEYPWTWEDGYAQNSNYGHSNTVSKLSTTFTVEEPSKFSFEVCVNGRHYSSEYHILGVDIDEKRYGSYSGNSSWSSSTGWIRKSVLLDPGKYTIEFLDSVNYSDSRTVSRLRNVELHSDWLEIDLASAGTLGAEVLYQVDVLGDVELLRVKGTLNAEDWAIIKQMKNLVGLDLTGARFDAVPDNGFDGLTYLSSVKLPEGMTSIGVYAFRGTQIWKIQIPATVTSIGERAFWETRLEEITFSEDSQLKIIGGAAFAYCASLKEFVMPNTVTTLKGQTMANGSSVFYCCTSLKKLHFSDALTHIPEYTCYECYRLSDVHWPKGLVSIGYQAFRDVDDLCSLEFPETLTSIGGECFWSNNSLTHVVLPAKLTSLGDNAFIYSEALKYIEFPSYIERYYRTLYGCIALDTIVCHAPTPPAVASDILSGGRAKSDVTLIVPAFSAVSYKLDSYWYQYGNIVASEEVQDYWRVAGDLALTNNRRMGGKPDIDLYYNGRMLVGGDAAFEAGTMNFFISESQLCRLLNNCPTMNVDSVNTYYSVNANTWYFFTPLYDVKVSDVTMSNDASYVIRYYDGAVRASAGTGSSWTDVPKDSVLLAGQGYIFRCNKACVVNIPADRSVHAQLFDFAAKEIALETHETETEANRNWNYVGNPYPCYYDIWYMDFTAPITVWTGSTYAAYSVTDDDFVLRPMQSFFVQKPDGVDSIRFRTEGRQLTNTVAHASYAARSTAPRFVFNLEIGTDSVADRTRVVFNAIRSMDYELACDASKFMSMDATVPQIYSLDEKGNRLAINERPKADGRVALGVYVAQAGEYTLSASRMDGKATLYDALTDSYTDLSETSYTFRAEGTGYIEDRFELMLEVPGGATGIDETGADTTVKVTVKEGFIRVSGAEGTAVQLYSIDGKQLQSQTISGGNALFVVPADGVYVVTANGVSQKAVVQEGWR